MRILKKLSKTAILIGILMFSGVMAGCGSEKEESYRSIQVYDIDGTGWVTREEVGEMELYANMQLQSHDQLRTDSESYVQLKLDEDKYVLLEPNTRIKIEAEGNAQDSRTKIVLVEGAVVNRIENKLSENSSYEVEAPNSTMAVRGTTFRVTTWEDENGNLVSEIEVQEGKVDTIVIVKKADGTVSEQVVSLEEGKKTTVSGALEGVDYVGKPMEYTYDIYENEVLNFIGHSDEKEQKPEETSDENGTEGAEKEEDDPEKTEDDQEDKKQENNTQVTPKEENPKEETQKEEPPKEETPKEESSGNSGSSSGSTDSGNSGSSSGSTGSESSGSSSGNTDSGNSGSSSGSTDSESSGDSSESTDSGSSGDSSGSTDSGNSGSSSGSTDSGNSGSSSGSTGSNTGGTSGGNNTGGTTTPTEFTVTFQLADGSPFATQTVAVSNGKGTAMLPILQPTASGAWYKDNTVINFPMEIEADTVLVWQ